MHGTLGQERKFTEAERLTEEANRAARDAHLQAQEALNKQHAAEAAQHRAEEIRRMHDAEAHHLAELHAKVSCPFTCRSGRCADFPCSSTGSPDVTAAIQAHTMHHQSSGAPVAD